MNAPHFVSLFIVRKPWVSTLAIIDKAALNFGVYVSVWTMFLRIAGIHLGVKL